MTPPRPSPLSAPTHHVPEHGLVEYVAGALIVEHYEENVSKKLHCRVQSVSTLLIEKEFTTAHVIWELVAENKGGNNHEFTNNVWVHTTADFEKYLAAKSIPYEEVRKQFQNGVEVHNAEETPYFAASMERKALSFQEKKLA